MAQFYVHPSNGRVGIGITSPAASLHVKSAGSTYLMVEKPNSTFQSGLQFRRAGTTQFLLYSDITSDALKIKSSVAGETDALPRMEFPLANKNIYVGLSGGMVGINTNAPSETLDVNGGVRIRTISQADSLSHILVTDTNGKIFWRNAPTAFSDLPFLNDDTSRFNLSVGVGTSAEHPGIYNTSFGLLSLVNTTGSFNAAFGYQSLATATGSFNAAFGFNNLILNTGGSNNAAFGFNSL